MQSEAILLGGKSLLNKNWKLRVHQNDLDLVQNILKSRGIEGPEEVSAYLSPSYKKGFHNPFLMKDMDKAVERINQAIDKKERIIVFGDYDVDGISGTAVLIKTLERLGAEVSYRLPHRVNDGYGLSNKFIEEFKEKNVKVLITVDSGISCKDQIDLAWEYGIDTIITDHHTIPENPPDRAYAILHPKQAECLYPFKGLTGSGVAFKLASALVTDRLPSKERDQFMYSLLDLASLGTVADIGPLLGENRIIVKYGLEALQNTMWPGLNHLMDYAGIDTTGKLDVSTIGFKIGPRINAAGRIDHPYQALQMLLYDGEDQEKGKSLAAKLEKLNQERQQMVYKALEEAFERVESDSKNNKILIAWSPDWHMGIIGLIAGRLVERHNIPAIVLQEFDEHLVASFRSNESFNAVDALNHVSHLLEHYGGHFQAAGFSIRKANLEQFIDEISKYAAEKLQDYDSEQELLLDADLSNEEINDHFVKKLTQMEPYGYGNEKPNFLLKNVKLEGIKRVGKEGNHLHCFITTGSNKYSAIAFKMGELIEKLVDAEEVDVVFSIDKNRWNGRDTIQFQLVDIKVNFR
ncbi:single-stranded-DNA-specific exonuclease RecJ [Candidatus Peregrinibacteria bacterium]|nr:single-stranded-DNA-specific exonuclease RecJ [Candidatus Peregrinibacteria bacterium]